MNNPDQPDNPTAVEHRVERTYEVAATPEQVWDAIATADGIAAWMVPTRLDPQIGGEVSFDGGFTSTASSPTTHRTSVSRTKNRGRSPTGRGRPAEMVEWFNTIGVPLSQVTTTCRRSPRSRPSSSSSQRPAAVA